MDRDLAAAGPEWKRAVELDPAYAEGLASYSHYLMSMDRNEEGLAMIRKALDLDPFNVTIHSFAVQCNVFARRYDEAIAEARATLAMQPNHPVALDGALKAYALKGMGPEAVAVMKEFYRPLQVPGLEAALDAGFVEGGLRGAAKRIAPLIAPAAQELRIVPTDYAQLYILAGDKEQAMKLLEKAFEINDPNIPYLRQPQYDPLRSDPRFQDLMRRAGLLEGGPK
jgi:tetratricopeptide (TPR) repeat protein